MSVRESLQKNLEPGTKFGKYRIVRLLGSGGMGAVYEVSNDALKKRFALKTLHSAFADSGEIVARFRREGESASKIRHPNVVDVSDVGEENGTFFLVMEYLEGQSLADLLEQEGALSVERTADIMLPVCAGIIAAHEAGVIHRDLKPDNIFLVKTPKGSVQPKVVDFGISKIANESVPSSLTNTGSMLGTPFYMSPEQMRSAKYIDARIDQYALGVILYECLVGERPFQAETLYEMMHKIATGDFQPPRVHRADIPEGLEAVVLRAMSKNPEDRFPSVRVLAGALLPYGSTRTQVLYAEELGDSGVMMPMPETSGVLGTAATTPVTPGMISQLRTAGALLGAANGASTGPGLRTEPVDAVNTTGGHRVPASPSAVRAEPLAQAATVAEKPAFVAPPAPAQTPKAVVAAGLAALAAVLFFAVVRLNAGSQEQPNTQASTTTEGYPVQISVEPTNATITLDGQVVGTGSFSRVFRRDGVSHQLTLSANGFVSRSFNFADMAPPERSVRLEAAPTQAAGPVVVVPGVPANPPVVVVPAANPPVQAREPSGTHRRHGTQPSNPQAQPHTPTGNGAPSVLGTGTNGAIIVN